MVLFSTTIVMVSLVAACALMIYLEKEFPSEKYDERQKIARGNAYRFSHWVGMVYFLGLMVYFVFHTGKTEWALEPFLLVTVGILIQLQCFHIYSLMTHSALPLGEKPIHSVISYLGLGTIYLVQYYFQYVPEDAAFITGAQSYNLLRLLISLSFYFLAIFHLVACFRDRKE